MAKDIVNKMLKTIRDGANRNRKEMRGTLNESSDLANRDNFLTISEILMEEAESSADPHARSVKIGKETPQFADVKKTQEDMITKTIGDQVKFDEDALRFYPDAEDIVINGSLPSLNSTFQFRFNDSSGEGVYLFADGLQLTEANARIVGKLRDAYLNWRTSLIEESDLVDKLKKSINK